MRASKTAYGNYRYDPEFTGDDTVDALLYAMRKSFGDTQPPPEKHAVAFVSRDVKEESLLGKMFDFYAEDAVIVT